MFVKRVYITLLIIKAKTSRALWTRCPFKRVKKWLVSVEVSTISRVVSALGDEEIEQIIAKD